MSGQPTPMDLDPESLYSPCFKFQCTNQKCRFGGIYSQWYHMVCPLCKSPLEQPIERKSVVKSKSCSLK